MFNIEHSICPTCGVGCGLNVIIKDGSLVGTNPYKNHEINEGRNCKNSADTINLYKETKIELTQDYETLIDKTTELLKSTDNDKITFLCSGKLNNQDLDKIISLTNGNNYNLLTYEYNFTKIDPELTVSYEKIEEADNIITIGDIYTQNSLIARRIIHAVKNGCHTINIDDTKKLTGYNSDEFISYDSFSEVIDLLDKQELEGNIIVIINKVNSIEQYQQIIDVISKKNMKILPVLQHPNSFSVLKKTNPSSIDDITQTINNSDVVILVDENPEEYLDTTILGDKKVISLKTIKDSLDSEIEIPVKAWYEQTGSFTNNAGIEQEFSDALQTETSSLKTITEIVDQIEGKI